MKVIRVLLAYAVFVTLFQHTVNIAADVLVEEGVAIQYLANSSNPGLGITWTAEGFDDSGWTSGAYGVGYENGSGGVTSLLQTSVPVGTSSVYTRTTFGIADVTSVNNVILGADYDDGYVAWINGVEVFHSGEMPAGAPDWNTVPASHESSNGSSPVYSPLQDISATALPALHNGTNTLAVGVYNRFSTSSDLVVVPRLSVNETVTRGPYLQMGTADSIVVRWRTASATDSRVTYGAAPGNLTATATDTTLMTEHEVQLTGLSADTTYYYAVGSSTGVYAGDDADHFFVTAPVTGTAKPTRIWVLGDSGTANANARAVRNAYTAYTGSTHTDLWLMLGDNAYSTGTDSEYQAAVFDIYPDMLRKSVLWSTLGNHDGASADSATQTGPYYDNFTFPTAGEAGGLASGTEAYYSFDYGSIHFISLESHETDRSPTGAMISWLQADVAATTQDWVIAFWHHPPYSKGSHDSDTETQLIEMRQNALPILEAAGVDLVLSGHSHSYERSFLLEGHYGTSDTLTTAMQIDAGDGRTDGDGAYKAVYDEANPYQGAVYITAGSSGQVSGGPLNHPVMVHASLNQLGSLVLDVNGNRLDATFLRHNGAVNDHFTILKSPDNCPLVSNPSQLDTDGDGDGDACDDDDDDDGLTDAFEQGINTDPLLVDTDGDSLSDFFEVNYDNDPAYSPGSDLNPLSIDTDGDGLNDGIDPAPLDPDVADGDVAPLGSPDGNLNAGDLVVMMRLVTGELEPGPIEQLHGDMYPIGNPDGSVNTSDLMILLQLLGF